MVFVLEVQHILWRPRVCGVSVPPGAPRRGAQPRGAHLMLGEVPALRPAARTGEKGAAPGEPAGGPQDACFRPWSGLGSFSAHYALEAGRAAKNAAAGP